MPVIKRPTGNYDWVISDGHLPDTDLECIKREPTFSMRWELICVVAWFVAATLCIVVLPQHIAPDPAHTSTAAAIAGFAVFLLGLYCINKGIDRLFDRMYKQHRFRKGRLRKYPDILDHYDPWYKNVMAHAGPKWREIGQEMADETVTGRVLEGIMLNNLWHVNQTRLDVIESGQWSAKTNPDAAALYQNAENTGRLLRRVYESHQSARILRTHPAPA